MRNLISAIFIFIMGIIVCWAFMSATVETQALREVAENDCGIAKTGQHCVVNGRQAVIITARRGK